MGFSTKGGTTPELREPRHQDPAAVVCSPPLPEQCTGSACEPHTDQTAVNNGVGDKAASIGASFTTDADRSLPRKPQNASTKASVSAPRRARCLFFLGLLVLLLVTEVVAVKTRCPAIISSNLANAEAARSSTDTARLNGSAAPVSVEAMLQTDTRRNDDVDSVETSHTLRRARPLSNSTLFSSRSRSYDQTYRGRHGMSSEHTNLAPLLCPTYEEMDRLQSTDLSAVRTTIETVMARYRSVKPNAALQRIVVEAHEGDSVAQLKLSTKSARVRFLTVATKLGELEARAVSGAIFSGVPLEIVGLGWRKFTLPQRFEMLLSYIEVTRMKDHDVIVMMDNDAMFLGEDPYPAVEAFVSLSPEKESDLKDVRGIRVGRRVAPIRFSAENYCMRRQVIAKTMCSEDYDVVEEEMEHWAVSHNVSYKANSGGAVNRNRFLNSGFMVARVWALKRYLPAFQQFMKQHSPRKARLWTSDQSVTSTLYLHLRWWEIVSGALDGKENPKVTPEQITNSGFYVAPVIPHPGYGPYGLPGGLIDIDEPVRWVFTVTMYALRESTVGAFGAPLSIPEHLPKRYKAQRRTRSDTLRKLSDPSSPSTAKTPVGVVRMPLNFGIANSPREVVDCTGAAEDLPHCSNRNAWLASLGMDGKEESVVRPLVWHFAGPRKTRYFDAFYHVLPWRMPTDFNADAVRVIREVLWAAPPVTIRRVQSAQQRQIPQVLGLVDDAAPEETLSFTRICTWLLPPQFGMLPRAV